MKGIIFGTEMVKELLKLPVGVSLPETFTMPYKCETRRLVPKQPAFAWVGGEYGWRWEFRPGQHGNYSQNNIEEALLKKARYKAGDTVYIKESWYAEGPRFAGYVEDTEKTPLFTKKNAMYLTEKNSRMKILIVGVSVVRLCDLTQQEAFAEGFRSPEEFWRAFCELNKLKYEHLDMQTAQRIEEIHWQHAIDDKKRAGTPPVILKALEASRAWCYCYRFRRIE